MGGPPSRSMWIVISLIIARMPVNTVQQFPEPRPRIVGLHLTTLRNPDFGEMGVLDGLSATQLFRGTNESQSKRQGYSLGASYPKPFNTQPECFYCQLPGHVARF
jgi:hypothetical protein